MTNRITKTTLQHLVDRLNAKLCEGNGTRWRTTKMTAHMDLDYAECYGGYCLVNYNGTHRATPRMSAKEMYHYLNGALDWITGDK